MSKEKYNTLPSISSKEFAENKDHKLQRRRKKLK